MIKKKATPRSKKKTYAGGVNVRVSQETYNSVKAHCDTYGLKIGKFFDQAAIDKVPPPEPKFKRWDTTDNL